MKTNIWKKTQILFVVLCYSIVSYAQALDTTAKKIQSLVVNIGNIVIALLVGVLLLWAGVSYMVKDKNDRSEEDTKELKSKIMRIIIGAAIGFGAVNIADWIISAIK
jgi:H+/gluconate symporter-like permease